MNSTETGVGDVADSQAEDKQKLKLEVAVKSPSACERHISVTVAEDEVKRYFDRACTELMPKADVAGFRSGRAPRKLVEQRFRKELQERVKSSLLLDAMTQVTEEQTFSAISEPDLDYDVVEVPDEGPMTFEFNLEVRPEFDPPDWKGLKLERPVREITTKEVDHELEQLLQSQAELVEVEGPVADEDFVRVRMVFRHGDEEVSELSDELVMVRPVISFSDATFTGFAAALRGAVVGEKRTGQVVVSFDAPSEHLRGAELMAEIEVLAIQRPGAPEVTQEVLDAYEIESEGALRDRIETQLKMQLEYYQKQRLRQQVTSQLTATANWELPPDLVRRQARRELDRAILELQRSGFSESQVQAHRNELRQNSLKSTETALKEHFILERVAEDLEIEAQAEDFDREIAMISRQAGMSPRATRAFIEKQGMSDALRNQIVERIVLDRIIAEAKITEVPFEPGKKEVEAVEFFVSGAGESNIPHAKSGGDQVELRQPTDYS